MAVDANELDLLIRHLSEKYDGTMGREEIEGAVEQARAELEEGSTNSEFLPVLIQRRVEELLAEGAQERGLDLGRVRQIIFLDDVNTGRSKVAAAFANGQGEGLIRARSSGVTPGDGVQERVLGMLRERGLDVDEETASLTGKAALAADLVVTMGLTDEQKREMPAHGLHQVDWDDVGPLPKGSDDDLGTVFDEIEERVNDLVRSLLDEDGSTEREVDPEVQEEIDTAIRELRDGDDS